MAQPKTYSNYPYWIVLVSNLVSLATYGLGAFIISQTPKIGYALLGLYITYIIWLELRVMSKSCVNCFYFGKCCAFGKGKITPMLFKKGDPKKFLRTNITWKDILPDFLVSIIPLIAGIVLLIIKFNWLILTSIVLLVVLASAGSGFVRSSLACKFCKQRELGCSAEQLFSKKNATKKKN